MRRACHSTFPHSPSKTGVNALMVGEVDARSASGGGLSTNNALRPRHPLPNPPPQVGRERTGFVARAHQNGESK